VERALFRIKRPADGVVADADPGRRPAGVLPSPDRRDVRRTPVPDPPGHPQLLPPGDCRVVGWRSGSQGRLPRRRGRRLTPIREDRAPSACPYFLTLMIVFPDRRSGELKTATASSRV